MDRRKARLLFGGSEVAGHIFGHPQSRGIMDLERAVWGPVDY